MCCEDIPILGDIEEAVRDVGRAFDDAILQPIGDVVEDVVDGVGDVLEKVGDTVSAILDNPKALAGVALSIAFPGAGAALGAKLGLGAGVAAQVAGQALINATINGGDVKAAVIGAVLPVAGKEIAGTLSATLDASNITGTVNNIITRAATQSATAAILGKDPLTAFVMGGVSAGVGAITNDIPGFKDLPAPAQNAISSAIGTKLVKGDVQGAVIDSLVDDAIQWAKTEINKTPNAIKAAQARYKAETGQTLSDSQMATLLETYGADGLPDAANRLFTTKSEAASMWRSMVGTEPTEFDLMEIEGLDQTQAQRLTENRANTTTEEATQFLRSMYGADYTPTTDQLMELIGRPERAAEVFANNIYVADKNETTEAEAIEFLKKAGLRESDFTQDQIKKLMGMPEAGAESLAIRTHDIQQTTFNGSGYGTKENAEKAALAAGYNSYTWNGQDFTVPPTAETKKIEERKYDLVEQVLKSQGTTIEKATDNELRGAMQKVNAVPTGMLGNATLQDIIKGNYSTFDTDGTLRVEITGAGALADSPNAKTVMQQLPPGLTLANESEVWGADGGRNPNVEYMVLPDGTAAFVKQSDGKPVGDFPLRGFSLDELADSDPEAWLQMASQFDKKSDGGVGDYLAKTANSIMLGAYATGNQKLGDSVKQTLSVVTQGVGEQTSNLAAFFTDRLGMDHNSAMAKAGKALQDWGAANQSKSSKEQEAAIIAAVSKAGTVGEKIQAFAVAAKDNPGGLMTMIAKEGVQEILPLWAAKAAYRFGTLAAVSANTAIEAIESWGAGTKGAYDEAKRMGFSDAEARTMASKVGLQSAVITTFTNGFGDNPLVKRVIGDTVKDSAAGIAKAGGREAFTEYFDGLGSNAAQQYQLTGTVNWDQATTAATIGAGVGVGTSSGIMLGAAINSNAVIGKGVDGSNVTYADFLSGAKQVDMKTVSLNAPVGTDADGEAITLGNIFAMPVASGLSYDVVKAGLPAALTNDDVVLGTDELGNTVTLSSLMGGVTEDVGFDAAYKNLLNVTPEKRTEAKYDYVSDIFKNLGYTPTAQEINDLIAQTPAVTQIDRPGVEQYVDPKLVSSQEVIDAYTALGLNKPTQADIDKLIGQYEQELLAGKAEENLGTAQFNVLTAEQEATRQALDELEAQTTEQYNTLNAAQKATADALVAQGQTLQDAIAAAQAETTGQIGELAADVQAKYDALSADQKALADAMAKQGLDLTAAIDLASQQTQAQITGLGEQVDTRINELMQQGQTYQEATQQAIGELNTQNRQLQDLVGTQGRSATQADVDALSEMLGGQRPVDLAYDVTGDKQVTQADIDFLTQVVSGVKTDYTPPVGSFLGPTGLYGELAAIEAKRQADLQAQLLREQEAAAAAAEAQRRGGISATLAQGQQGLRQISQQLPQAFQQAQEVSTPIYGQMGPYLELGSPLDVGFFQPSPEKQAATKQQQPTKIAAGGYIDDLLAGDMTADDLLNLLR